MTDTEESATGLAGMDGGADDEQSGGGYSDFENMLNDENTNPDDLISYINTNIAAAEDEIVNRFLTGLLGFGDDIRDIDFTGLEDSRQYLPEDMIAFMDLMKLEADTPSMVLSDEENRRVINMTLTEMLERALLFEQHLEKYPDNVTTDAAARLYEEIATNAISGGYDSAEGISHYYHGDTEDVVDSDALQYYQQFVDANEDSNLGQIVSDYITLLQQNQFEINDELEDFYKGLYARLDVDAWIGKTADTVDSTDTQES